MTTDQAILDREDVVLFINAACACTGQTEFYGDSKDQRISISFLHEYMFVNYRRLYGLCLFAGINQFNQMLIIETLLREGAPKDDALRVEEGARIRQTLQHLPPQRVYRLFRRLRKARVNNRRTRATVRAWLEKRDLVFDALKYRGLLRSIVRHVRMAVSDDLGAFLFEGPHSRKTWSTPLLETFRRARYEQASIYALPFTVAEGLAAAHNIPRKRFLEKIKPRMSAAERRRTFKSVERLGLSSDVDIGRIPLTNAMSILLSLPIKERNQRWRDGIQRAVDRTLAGRVPLAGRVRVVLDSSFSSRGGAKKRNRPLAVALGIGFLLSRCPDVKLIWTHAPDQDIDPLSVRPLGQTDLATPMLLALEDRPDWVIVVSDGFENDPPGAVSEILRLFREHIDLHGSTRVVHLNPVFDATAFMPRPLGQTVPTVGIRAAEDLLDKLPFAQFTVGTQPLSALERWLELRAGESR